MVTVQDIRDEVAGSAIVRIQMNAMMKKLKKFENKIGPEPLQDILLGKRKLSLEEFTAVSHKFGTAGIAAIQAMENMNPAQKEYLFERMGWKWDPAYLKPQQVPTKIVSASDLNTNTKE
jgi:hypothetical protein